MSEPLKPCPICHSTDEMQKFKWGKDVNLDNFRIRFEKSIISPYWIAHCGNCEVSFILPIDTNIDDAIKYWNGNHDQDAKEFTILKSNVEFSSEEVCPSFLRKIMD